MGAYTYTTPDGPEICFSRGTWLLVDMCDPWYVETRDGSEIRPGVYQIDHVHISALQAADAEVPETLAEYKVWRSGRQGIPLDDITERDYEEVRTFLRDAASGDTHAQLSY